MEPNDGILIKPAIQALSILIAVLGIYGWGWWMRIFTHAKLWAIAPLWYFSQMLLFYLLTIFFEKSLGTDLVAILSAALHLEGVFIVAGSAFIMLYVRLRILRRQDGS